MTNTRKIFRYKENFYRRNKPLPSIKDSEICSYCAFKNCDYCQIIDCIEVKGVRNKKEYYAIIFNRYD